MQKTALHNNIYISDAASDGGSSNLSLVGELEYDSDAQISDIYEENMSECGKFRKLKLVIEFFSWL